MPQGTYFKQNEVLIRATNFTAFSKSYVWSHVYHRPLALCVAEESTGMFSAERFPLSGSFEGPLSVFRFSIKMH